VLLAFIVTLTILSVMSRLFDLIERNYIEITSEKLGQG